MRKRGILRSFIITMSALGLFLVLLWIIFYYTTSRVLTDNLTAQARAASDSIIMSIEDQLLSMEDSAYALSCSDAVRMMVGSQDTLEFYDRGHLALLQGDSLIENHNPADSVVVINSDGLYYRLKGQISNTALRRAYYLLRVNSRNVITVSANNNTYIGCCEKVVADENKTGYAVVFKQKKRLDDLLLSFDEIEYLGTAILSDKDVISSNREFEYDDIEDIRNKSLFFREKEIGTTGLRLLVYCEDTVSEALSDYYRIALPVIVVTILLVMSIFIWYWNKHTFIPINNIIKNTNDVGDRPLPLTGEAYFDDLVGHVNDTLSRIEERDKALYEAGVRIKESELEAERNLVLLLKKQISAHFTVNTLNAVRALINKGESEVAARMCTELSSLLRYANAIEEYISLYEEFHVLDQYASIMQTRYPNKFSFETEDDDIYSNVYIPRMLLQPLVENSIIHGFADQSGSIHVSATVSDRVCISVRDDGKGIDEAELDVLKERIRSCDGTQNEGIDHVALINIQKRIRIVCGGDYGIDIISSPGSGCEVILDLPRMDDTDH